MTHRVALSQTLPNSLTGSPEQPLKSIISVYSLEFTGKNDVAIPKSNLDLTLLSNSDAGTATCAGYPASLGTEQIDAQTFSSWGVDCRSNCQNDSVGDD